MFDATPTPEREPFFRVATFIDPIDQFGRWILARRARKVLGPALGVNTFTVTPERWTLVGLTNHVQIELDGYDGVILLHSLENAHLGHVICRHVYLAVHCPDQNCRQTLATAYLSRRHVKYGFDELLAGANLAGHNRKYH